MYSAEMKDPHEGLVDWSVRTEELKCSVIVGCILGRKAMNEWVKIWTIKPIGMMEWGGGKWRVLFATPEEAKEVSKKRHEVFEGMMFTLRWLGEEKRVEVEERIEYTTTFTTGVMSLEKEEVIRIMIEETKDEGLRVEEVTSEGLKTGQWTLRSTVRQGSFFGGGVTFHSGADLWKKYSNLRLDRLEKEKAKI